MAGRRHTEGGGTHKDGSPKNATVGGKSNPRPIDLDGVELPDLPEEQTLASEVSMPAQPAQPVQDGEVVSHDGPQNLEEFFLQKAAEDAAAAAAELEVKDTEKAAELEAGRTVLAEKLAAFKKEFLRIKEEYVLHYPEEPKAHASWAESFNYHRALNSKDSSDVQKANALKDDKAKELVAEKKAEIKLSQESDKKYRVQREDAAIDVIRSAAEIYNLDIKSGVIEGSEIDLENPRDIVAKLKNYAKDGKDIVLETCLDRANNNLKKHTYKENGDVGPDSQWSKSKWEADLSSQTSETLHQEYAFNVAQASAQNALYGRTSLFVPNTAKIAASVLPDISAGGLAKAAAKTGAFVAHPPTALLVSAVMPAAKGSAKSPWDRAGRVGAAAFVWFLGGALEEGDETFVNKSDNVVSSQDKYSALDAIDNTIPFVGEKGWWESYLNKSGPHMVCDGIGSAKLVSEWYGNGVDDKVDGLLNLTPSAGESQAPSQQSTNWDSLISGGNKASLAPVEPSSSSQQSTDWEGLILGEGKVNAAPVESSNLPQQSTDWKSLIESSSNPSDLPSNSGELRR